MADPQVGEQRTFNGQLATWDGKGWTPVSSEPQSKPRSWTDTAVDALPAAGGAVGGLVGGLGGTAFGLGIGGVPGAVGGAALGGASGEAAKQLVNRMRGVPDVGTMTQAATNIGESGAVQGALEGAGQAVPAALKAGGTAVYRGYLKPSLSRVNLPKATQIVKDAISEALPVTASGAQRASDLIGQLNGKVDDLLSQATGKTVNMSDIADTVRTWAKRMYDRPGRDPQDYQAVLKVADRLDSHGANPFNPAQPASATMPAANQIKQDLQASARGKFGIPGGTAETAGEKYASSQTRQAIEQQVPDVGPLNARQSRLIDVARSLNQAIGREGNQSAVQGVKTLESLGVGSAAGAADYQRRGNASEAAIVGAVTSLGGRMAMTPAVMSRAAILAVKMGEKLPGTAAADVARAALQAASEQQGQQ